MAGHNKWSSITHRKGAQDAKRAKVWTKVTTNTVSLEAAQDATKVLRISEALEDSDFDIPDKLASQLIEA